MNCPIKTPEVPRVLDATPCGKADLNRLTRMMLDEFGDVHERLGGHEEPFDTFDQRFDHMDEQFAGVHAELELLDERRFRSGVVYLRYNLGGPKA